MKKSEPKMILNLSLEDEELYKKINIAIDDYIQKIEVSELEDKVKNLIDRRLEELLHPARFNYIPFSKIDGKSLEDYIKGKVDEKIQKVIDEEIGRILSVKLGNLFTSNS